jgi:hypothetical protein
MDEKESTITTIGFREGTYSGELTGGTPHGKGMYTCDNYSYNGEWHKGDMSGYGVMVFSDGSIYDGFWESNLRQGNGILLHPNGTTYEGEWKNGIRDGKGVLKLPDGVRKEGVWVEDKYDQALSPEDLESEVKQDEGSDLNPVPYRDGNYKGEMKNGLPHGRGFFVSKAFDYKGEWKDGLKSGQGTLKTTDATYRGEWESDQRHGHGIETILLPGLTIRYEGNWFEDKKHGHGILRISNGTIYEGGWKNNKKYGFGDETISIEGDNNKKTESIIHLTKVNFIRDSS